MIATSPAMVIHTTVDGVPASISLTDRALTVGRDEALVVAWDLGGRLYSVVDGRRTCRRGLNGRVLIKRRENGERQRSWASQAEADALVDRAAGFASTLVAATRLPDDTQAALERAAKFDSRAAAADSARFRDIYQPIGILPPDQYLALVLQATEGCSFRSCTFCDFYREPYRVKSAAQFAEHVARVCDYLGDSERLRRRAVFLGSANALAVPMSGLLPIFDFLVERFPARPVFAFLDGFTGALKDAADYRALAVRGLRRVYIGLESGHDALLAFVRKPSTRDQVIQTVRAIKSAGVNVGVIAMVGLGGDRFAEAHVADTARAITEMKLGPGDLLYFSELVDLPGSPYVSAAAEAGIRALGADERVAQRRAIASRLEFPASPPQMATYDVREFVY
jgi:radical SAM superfamily enzyme YgiQ (UPF0313 family)